jgi:hypothetical protein
MALPQTTGLGARSITSARPRAEPTCEANKCPQRLHDLAEAKFTKPHSVHLIDDDISKLLLENSKSTLQLRSLRLRAENIGVDEGGNGTGAGAGIQDTELCALIQ